MARILIVDDENNIRTMLRLALAHTGHAPDTAADGVEGLEKFGATGSRWDLVLLDQRMPGLEGLDVLRAMRQRDPHACVLMMTAFGTVDLAAEAIQAGAADFLRKPFTIETLRGAVQIALDRSHNAAESVSPEEGRPPISFEQAHINGFLLTSTPDTQIDPPAGGVVNAFLVRSATGEERPCVVILDAAVVDQVTTYADPDSIPDAAKFWQALCGEALANYLWQNADFPDGDRVLVEDLTTGLRHWIDTVLTAGQAP